MSHYRTVPIAIVAFALVLAAPGCALDGLAPGAGPDHDLAGAGDLAFAFAVDSGPPPTCDDPAPDPSCRDYSPSMLPLGSDPQKDPNEQDSGLSRDGNGWLKLDSPHPFLNYLWIANYTDLSNDGSVSKIDARTVREVARYRTVTCSSLKTGSSDACDGTYGCCSIDDWPRYQARKMHQQQPGHQAVQLHILSPSRTSVDFNGDLFISNRAFGGQSSVTKILNDVAGCIDRNHDGRIDTSRDANGDGFIQTDCNGNGQADDIADVRAKACTNGLPQELYGLDDECVVWTSNTFPPNAIGRPLGLAEGANGADVSDAWAGSFTNGNFVRIDGSTGLDKYDVQLPRECYAGTGPYGLVVDAQGIGWAPDFAAGKLCYFDTGNGQNVGSVRDPLWGPMQGYGVTMDRDQNVWVGQSVARYTPDRSNGFKNLGNGWWVHIKTGGDGIGIAADSRNAAAYFVYACLGRSVLQIPASTIKAAGMDQEISSSGWPIINMPCYGVGVDSDQNVWGVNVHYSTRALVDKGGTITQPNVNGAAMGNNLCPKGDTCPNAGAYTYSDFTGFGVRTFTVAQGRYGILVPGCADTLGQPAPTEWWQVAWEADTPPGTSLDVHARSGNDRDLAAPSWGSFTPDGEASPLELQGVLAPNRVRGDGTGDVKDGFLFVEFLFTTHAQNATPKLKSFAVRYRCPPR